MPQENQDSKWEGKSSAELRSITAQQLWPLFEDFCTLHKFVPALDSEKCRHVEGSYGKPGLIRYCVFTQQSSSSNNNNDTDNSPTKWCNEKLLSMDPVQRTLTYEVTDNNLGFTSYAGNVHVTDIDDGCKIEWSFMADPVEGMRLDDLRWFLESNLKSVADEMEAYLSLMSKENKGLKWEGKSMEVLKGITVEELWPLFEDFCSIHKWVPALDSDKCGHVEGDYGKPGLVRYCAFTERSISSSLANDMPVKWCNEKLISMDPVERTLSYEVTENNLGFGSYVGEVKVMEVDGGCRIEWSFMADPVEGMGLEDLRGFLVSNLKMVADGMRKELRGAAN